jgi:hypothetical protein
VYQYKLLFKPSEVRKYDAAVVSHLYLRNDSLLRKLIMSLTTLPLPRGDY